MFIKVLLLLLAVTWSVSKATAYGEIDIECKNDTCTRCYKTLATELLKNADNYIALQSTFFPPDDSGPDFVIVTYIFDDPKYLNKIESTSQNLSSHIWFWSSSAYFFYHPLQVIQFTSLGFSDPSLRQKNIALYLPASCYYQQNNTDRYHDHSGPFNMKLLTQRLKLFAMHQKITGQIDSTYTAQSHNLESLQDWHMKNSHVSKLVLSSQVIFPFFASIFLALYFIYLIESEPANLGKKLNSQVDDKSPDEIKAAANSQVWIIVTISILFTSGAIATDIAALVEYSLLSKEIEYYINHNSSSAFVHLHVVPITMLFYDSLSTVFILVPFIVACCKCCKWTCKFKCCKTFGCYGEDGKCVFKISDILYTLLSPFTCIATHSYHIIFSFINNPYHATSVLLPVYIMTLFVVVVMLQKIFYFVLSGFQKFSDVQKRKKCAYGVIVIFYTVAIIATAGCIGLTVAVLIVLPLNNAIDLASNEIYAIYQASVTVFAALVTFQVLFRETNSSLAVLIKAADKYDSVTSLRKWEDMSEKEKEVQLGRIILSRVNFKKSEKETVGTQTGCCCAACYSYQRTREMEAGTQTELDNKKPTDASPTVNNKEPIIYPVYISNNTIPLKSTTNW